MEEEQGAPDYVRLAAEVLHIANAPPDLARRLVSQALVVEDRREAWKKRGADAVSRAPSTAGVYIFRDEEGRALYVGKAVNLRRRLGAHFANRRWRAIKAPLARVAGVEWIEVGSELEALLREAELIERLEPIANVQVQAPDAGRREVPSALLADVIVIVPSIDSECAEIVGARLDGGWLMRRSRRNGADLRDDCRELTRFFRPAPGVGFDGTRLAPILFSWLAGRGREATRLDPRDQASARQLRERLGLLLSDPELFTHRIVVR